MLGGGILAVSPLSEPIAYKLNVGVSFVSSVFRYYYFFLDYSDIITVNMVNDEVDATT